MCGRYTLRNPTGHRWLTDAPGEMLVPRYNIAPSQQVLVVGRSAEGEQVVRPATWGFRPRWLEAKRRAPINARAETAATTPMFRGAFQRGRALLAADGYYEWSPSNNGPKQPHFFHQSDDSVFWFAGLATTDSEGNRTCVIVTVDANDTAAPIHSRMPLILPDDAAATAWIDPEAKSADLTDLLQPPANDVITAYPVSRHVNRPDHDDPRCVAAIEDPGH